MEPAGAIDPHAQTGRKASRLCAARDCQCGVLPTARRRRLAPVAPRSAPLGDYLPLLEGLAEGRHLGARARYPAHRGAAGLVRSSAGALTIEGEPATLARR